MLGEALGGPARVGPPFVFDGGPSVRRSACRAVSAPWRQTPAPSRRGGNERPVWRGQTPPASSTIQCVKFTIRVDDSGREAYVHCNEEYSAITILPRPAGPSARRSVGSHGEPAVSRRGVASPRLRRRVLRAGTGAGSRFAFGRPRGARGARLLLRGRGGAALRHRRGPLAPGARLGAECDAPRRGSLPGCCRSGPGLRGSGGRACGTAGPHGPDRPGPTRSDLPPEPLPPLLDRSPSRA